MVCNVTIHRRLPIPRLLHGFRPRRPETRKACGVFILSGGKPLNSKADKLKSFIPSGVLFCQTAGQKLGLGTLHPSPAKSTKAAIFIDQMCE